MTTETGDYSPVRKRTATESEARVRTGAVMTLIAVLVFYFSRYPYVLEAAAAVLSIMGIVELLRAAGHCTWRNVLLLSLIAVAICMRRLPYYGEILLITWILAIVAFALFMRHRKEVPSIGFWQILPCTLMLPIFFYSAVEIRQWPQGLAVLIFVILGCTINDVAAYFVGKAFGAHKLAPTISPGKTVEGGLGGMISSVILMSFFAFLYSSRTGIAVPYGWLLLYLFLASVVGQFGDLAMSTIKRTVGIKDFGHILPGHGGILDRFDSFLFVAPFAVIYGNLTGCFM